MKYSAFSLCTALLFAAFSALHGEDPPKGSTEEKAKQVVVGKNVTLEVEGEKKRVLIAAEVCLREGQLEQLMTRKQTKEHEAILSADADARHIHAALILTGAKAGSTVKFDPKFTPPSGTKILIQLRYTDKGKTVTVPAQKWVRTSKEKKELPFDWVFAGSKFVPNRDNPKELPYFLANDGDVISVSNFESALLDLNIQSPKDNDDLIFEAVVDNIPPKGTKVTLILEPVFEEKKDK